MTRPSAHMLLIHRAPGWLRRRSPLAQQLHTAYRLVRGDAVLHGFELGPVNIRNGGAPVVISHCRINTAPYQPDHPATEGVQVHRVNLKLDPSDFRR